MLPSYLNIRQSFEKTKKYSEIECSLPTLHRGIGVVEHAIQTLKNLIIANLQDKIEFTQSIDLSLKTVSFSKPPIQIPIYVL